MVGGERDQQHSVAEQKAKENAILARAVAIKVCGSRVLTTIVLSTLPCHWVLLVKAIP